MSISSTDWAKAEAARKRRAASEQARIAAFTKFPLMIATFPIT
jgi:hypothetical protein